MVRVTAQAATALEELLADNAAPAEADVRLAPAAGGNLGMAIDARREGDEVISRVDHTPLLLVDAGVAPGLSDMVVDF